MNDTKYFTTICQLENGKRVPYDFADKDRNGYDDYPVIKHLKYLGKGTIYSIGGVKDNYTEILHFWKKIR